MTQNTNEDIYQDSIEVRIKPTKELFFNETNYFGIYAAEVHPDDLMQKNIRINKYGNISIKGTVPRLNMKEEYLVLVKEDSKSNYEGSYILETIKQDKPITVREQKAFLEVILTPTQVENIYEVYSEKDNVVELIENNEFDYTKVKGFGQKSFEKLKKKVLEKKDIRDILAFCDKYQIKYDTIASLEKKYKNAAVVLGIIQENPYELTSVKGIGFKKADEIAKAVGISMISPYRINACIHYCVGQENANGHSWVAYQQLLNSAIEMLNIPKSEIEDRLKAGIRGIKIIDDQVTKESIYYAEKYIAEYMVKLKTKSKKMFETEEIDTFLKEYTTQNNIELDENQVKFFHDWNENSILFLVAGGGAGKTFLQKILLELVDTKNLTTALLAPTGRAARVMSEYCKGRPASTIHRRTNVDDLQSSDDEDKKEIAEDIIIVDESSMCDVFVLLALFQAITNDNVRILFVGDDFQLPSVGVGNFLYDVIQSNCIKVSKLTKVFRQSEGGILDVSTNIRKGVSFLRNHEEGRKVFGKDCVMWLVEQDYLFDGIITNYKKTLTRFSPDDIVILSPTKKGKLGTDAINKEIQKIANPPSLEKKEYSFGNADNPTIFRVGDLVMNKENIYGVKTTRGKTDVFNGDTGKIRDIDEENKEIIIDFDGELVKFPFRDIFSQISHCWATTIHKSQGSEYPVAIVVLDKSMTYQLNANLMYTGMSRAKQFMLVLSQAKTINNGMTKFENMARRSFLQEMIKGYNDTSKLVEQSDATATATEKEIVVKEKREVFVQESLYF